MADRTGIITFKGTPLTLTGSGTVSVGDPAPDAILSKSPTDDVKLSDFRGKKVILNTMPSLDTSTCSFQGARFNAEALKLGDDVVVLAASMDLPTAQARWCEANKAEAIQTLSDYKHRDLGEKFGIRIKELGLLTRTVHILDAEGVVRYIQVVPEVSKEPDYEDALKALAGLG